MNASQTSRTEHARHPKLSLSIQLGNGIATLPASRAQLRRWAAAAIEADAVLTLRFVGQDEGRMLNREYRGLDHPTNVLTFSYDLPAGLPVTPGGDHPAGSTARDSAIQADIVICVPVLEREARERRIPLAHHLAHLVVHGVLHACGHDHERDDEAREMEALETALLARFRIADPYRA